jgi:hypothetical protein
VWYSQEDASSSILRFALDGCPSVIWGRGSRPPDVIYYQVRARGEPYHEPVDTYSIACDFDRTWHQSFAPLSRFLVQKQSSCRSTWNALWLVIGMSQLASTPILLCMCVFLFPS